MGHAHGSLEAPFADIHVEDGVVRVTLLHDPVVDGVDMAIYIDGSASMAEEFEYRDDLPSHDDDHDHAPPVATQGAAAVDAPAKTTPKGEKSWIAKLFGWFSSDDDDHDDDAPHAVDHDDDHDDDHPPQRAAMRPGERTNMVEPQVRRMLQYLATKDRNGTLRVAYWACGTSGSHIEEVGEVSGVEAATFKVPGPNTPGSGTRLAPAMKDFVTYMEAAARNGAKRGCGVFVTDGQINDLGGVMKLSATIAGRIASRSLPPLHLVLVGVGDAVSESQMEEISHAEFAGVEHLWCHRVAEEMHEMAELVSGLVDSTMTVASGGTVYGEHGEVVKRYERRLPAVLEFTLPAGQRRFTLEIEGRRYTQSLPREEHH
jgi:hypothetical protein